MKTLRLLSLLVLAFGLTFGVFGELPEGEAGYDVVWQKMTPFDDAPQAFRADNPAQGFQVYFTDGGIRVLPAVELDPTWEFEFEFSGCGRHADVLPLGEAVPVNPGGRIEYARPASMEIYSNGPGGLDIRLQVDCPPKAAGPAYRKLRLEARVAGDLRGEASADGRSVGFFRMGSPFDALRFDSISVEDAEGRPLFFRIGYSLHIERGTILQLTIEDRDAAYPLSVGMVLRGGADGLMDEHPWEESTENLPREWTGGIEGPWAAGDYNGDGFPDLASGGAGRPLRLFASVPDVATLFPWDEVFLAHPELWPRMIVPVWTSTEGIDSKGLGWADVDADGDQDLLVGSEIAPERVFLNRTIREHARNESLPGPKVIQNGSFESGDLTGWTVSAPDGVWCSGPTVLCGTPIPGIPCAPGLYPTGLWPYEGNCLFFTGWTFNSPGPAGGPPWAIQIYQDAVVPLGATTLTTHSRMSFINNSWSSQVVYYRLYRPGGGPLPNWIQICLGSGGPSGWGWDTLTISGLESYANQTIRIQFDVATHGVSPPDYSEFALDDFTFDWNPFTVSGYKFHDLNGNGVDDGEPRLDGFEMQLQEFWGGQWNTVQTTTTAGGGLYSFTISLPSPNEFRVREAATASWPQTTPQPPTFLATAAGVLDENISGYENLAFGNFETFTVEGTKFLDENGNGVMDAGETGLPSWTIFLDENVNGVWDPGESTYLTDAAGFFRFTSQDNVPDPLPVIEVMQPGWMNITPNPVSVPISGGATITVDFGNFQPITIGGLKFEDGDGNGIMDPGEPGLAGWTIYLDDNGSGTLDPGEQSTVTAGGGLFEFPGLGPGTYRVRESAQAGWIQTTPDPADIVATSGLAVPPIVFGNRPCEPTCSASADPASGHLPLQVQFAGAVVLPPGCPPSAATWSWDFGDGVGTSTDQNPLYTYTTWGGLTWTLTASVNGYDCTFSGTVDVWPYDLVFMDDYNRSLVCVNSSNGSWSWTYFDPRMGTGSFNGDGLIRIQSGIMTIQSIAGTPWTMSVKYNTLHQRAYGFFLYRAFRLRSGLSDLDTTNNQVICASPPAP